MGLTSQTKQLPTSSPQVQGLQNQLIRYIGGQGFEGLNPSTQVDPASIQPYLDMFTLQRQQAIEGLGNLTGSGVGTTLAKTATSQGAFLANLFEQRRQQDANRFLQLLLGTLGSPAGQMQNVTQPGLLDSLFAGVGAAAPIIGGALASRGPTVNVGVPV